MRVRERERKRETVGVAVLFISSVHLNSLSLLLGMRPISQPYVRSLVRDGMLRQKIKLEVMREACRVTHLK